MNDTAKSDESTNPHDELFKQLIQTFFKEFIQLFWPDKAKQIDFRALHFLSQEMYADKAKGKRDKRRLDIVGEVKIKGRTGHILIHVEHQSTRQTIFPKRMFNYFCHLWLAHQNPIFPIALFSDDNVWRKPIPDHFEIEVLGKKVLEFRYELVKLKNLDWRKYLNHDNPVAMALMAKMGFAEEEMPRVKAEITRIFVTGKYRNHSKSGILDNFIQYYLPMEGKSAILYKKELKRLGLKLEDVKMVLSKPYQKKLDEGIALGELKGKLSAVENMLEEGCDWSFIKKITGITKNQYEKHSKKK